MYSWRPMQRPLMAISEDGLPTSMSLPLLEPHSSAPSCECVSPLMAICKRGGAREVGA
jgi:hypothetical protein